MRDALSRVKLLQIALKRERIPPSQLAKQLDLIRGDLNIIIDRNKG